MELIPNLRRQWKRNNRSKLLLQRTFPRYGESLPKIVCDKEDHNRAYSSTKRNKHISTRYRTGEKGILKQWEHWVNSIILRHRKGSKWINNLYQWKTDYRKGSKSNRYTCVKAYPVITQCHGSEGNYWGYLI